MKKTVSLTLALFLGLQLLLPVQALEASDFDPDSPETATDEPQLPEEPAEDTGLSTVQPEASEETSEEVSEQPEVPEENSDQSDTSDLPDTPGDAWNDAQVDLPEQPEETPAVAPAEEEVDRLYNGQEADYEDPQFCKLLEDGFFDFQVSAASDAPTFSVSHDSRFQGYGRLKGIDISKWNDITSWSSLAKEVDFAIIRCGNRSVKGSGLSKDPKFHEYMKAAQSAGLEVGVYIYSQAITEQEAREEANLALEMCKGYTFRLPIVIDYEYYTSGRLKNAKLSKNQRTKICRAFCEVIEAAGYPAMIYANKSMLIDDMNGEQLAQEGYEIWLAHWVNSSNYANTYTYWQYTDRGHVNGINGYVDMNYYYKLPEAKLSRTYCCANGVRLFWNKVDLADQYRIYRKKEGTTAWTELGVVSGADPLTYLDKTAQAGVAYRYAVQSCDGTVRAAYDRTGTAVVYQPQLSLTDAKIETSGVRLIWTPMDGYDGYRIYRRSGTAGQWTLVTTITDPTQGNYLDTQVAGGSLGGSYSYTIRGLSGGRPSASYDTYGLQVTWLNPPVLVSADTGSSGMLVRWKAVDQADGYYVYRLEQQKWNHIATVKGCNISTYLDKAAYAFGKSYTYTVRAYADSSRSSYDKEGVSGICMKTPKLVSAKAVSSGIQITWEPTDLATQYYIYRKTGKDTWNLLKKVTETTFLDKTAEDGVSYTYTVRGATDGGRSSYDTKGVSALHLATPAPKADRTSTSVKISWPTVTGAVKYRVYRRTTGRWQSLGTTTNTSFTDPITALTANTTYFYTVRAYDSNGLSSSYHSTGAAYHNLASPVLLSASAGSKGIQVRWKPVTGASQYYLYRKSAGTSWSRVATVKNGCSYVDTKAVSGVAYTYTVRAACQNGISWHDSHGVTSTFLSAPQLQSAVSSAKGVTVTWASVPGATSYTVYRRLGAEPWTRLSTVSDTRYLDSSQLSSGSAYAYTVRAWMGKQFSDYDRSGLSYLCLKIPTVTKISNISEGIQLTWGAVSGATEYTVYRRTAGTSWHVVGKAKAQRYTDTTAISGTTYIYTLRACAGQQRSFYNTTGYTCLRLDSPELANIKQTDQGIQLSWLPVTGAMGYRVYRKAPGTGWKLLKLVSGTSYQDTDSLSENTLYRYTVRAYSGKTLGFFDPDGLSLPLPS